MHYGPGRRAIEQGSMAAPAASGIRFLAGHLALQRDRTL